ncbi:MAG: GC-type dockerin domain-anchored protein [Phycisphaerales bacterium JB064]
MLAEFSETTTLMRTSDVGHGVGWQSVLGLIQPFVVTEADGLTQLPLPDGYLTGLASGVNNDGVVVGAMSMSTLPFDIGQPAIWLPDGMGGYQDGIVLDTPDFVQGPRGPLASAGGIAVDINDDGTIVGWTRAQGFQGGPATLFSMTAEPVNLQELGFQATPTDLSETGVVVGGRLRMVLDSLEVTDIGVPGPLGGTSFSTALIYGVNDADEVVVAADLASTVFENYLCYTHSDAAGYMKADPSELPARFVGFYDINNRGDVVWSAGGGRGILFRDEGQIVRNPASLVAGGTPWQIDLGHLDNRRRMITTAFQVSPERNAIVMLTTGCEADLDGDGELTIFDFLEYQNLFDTGDLAADFDGDGSLTIFDFLAFQNAFDTGC